MTLPILSEDFASETGSLSPYRKTTDQTTVIPRTHADIRAYHSTDIVAYRTVLDMERWNAWHWDTFSMFDLENGLVLEGREFAHRDMADVDALYASTTLNGGINNSVLSLIVTGHTGFPADNGFYIGITNNEILHVTSGAGTNTWTVARGQLGTTAHTHANGDTVLWSPIEGMTLADLEFVLLGLGNENWPVDPDVVIGKNAAWRYQNYMSILAHGGVEKVVESSYSDDLLTDFPGTHYIDIPIRSLTAQSVINHLNLTTSAVEFTDTDDWTNFASLPFSASLNSITAGGDTYLRYDRDSLTGIDLSDIKGIRFRLNAVNITPGTGPTAAVGAAGAISATVDYRVTFVSAAGESTVGPASNVITLTAQRASLTGIPTGPTGVTARKIYRRAAGSGSFPSGTTYPSATTYPGGTSDYRLVATIADNTTTTLSDNYVVLGSEAQPPTVGSAGDVTFYTQDMRLISAGYTYQPADIDTKRHQFTRSIPQAGVEWGSDFPMVYLTTSRAKNVTQYIRFNSGHIPVAANKNEFSFVFRYVDPNNYMRIRLRSDTTSTRVATISRVAGVDTTINETAMAVLTAEKDYILIVDVFNTAVISNLYSTNGIFLETLVNTTTSQTLPSQNRGQIGFEFLPYNYDFTIQYINNAGAEFGTFVSENFPSKQTVVGASIYPQNSGTISSIDATDLETFEGISAIPETTVTLTSSAGRPAPAIQVERLGLGWFGGVRSTEVTINGDSRYIDISGDLYPVAPVGGQFRIILFDIQGLVAYIHDIPTPVANTWNHFEIPVLYQLAPAGYKLVIENIGFAPNHTAVWRLDNVAIDHQTVKWEASADNGAHWQNFFRALSSKYKGIKFGTRGKDIKVRATALTDDAWIHSYELVPRYQTPGHS